MARTVGKQKKKTNKQTNKQTNYDLRWKVLDPAHLLFFYSLAVDELRNRKVSIG